MCWRPPLALALALPLLALACHDRSAAPPARTDEPTPALEEDETTPKPPPPETKEHDGGTFDPKPPGPPGHHGADELHRLEGHLESDLLHEFGEPTSKREFTMRECCTEFEIELLNTYPPNGGHEAVVIHQWDWDYEGYTLTVWLHQVESEWLVLETSRYSDDVEF